MTLQSASVLTIYHCDLFKLIHRLWIVKSINYNEKVIRFDDFMVNSVNYTLIGIFKRFK